MFSLTTTIRSITTFQASEAAHVSRNVCWYQRLKAMTGGLLFIFIHLFFVTWVAVLVICMMPTTDVFPCSTRDLLRLLAGPLTLHVVAPLDFCSSVRLPSHFWPLDASGLCWPCVALELNNNYHPANSVCCWLCAWTLLHNWIAIPGSASLWCELCRGDVLLSQYFLVLLGFCSFCSVQLSPNKL